MLNKQLQKVKLVTYAKWDPQTYTCIVGKHMQTETCMCKLKMAQRMVPYAIQMVHVERFSRDP